MHGEHLDDFICESRHLEVQPDPKVSPDFSFSLLFYLCYSTQGEFKVSERYLTMDDLTTALVGNRVKEMFGSGTAGIVCPISGVLYKDQVRRKVLYVSYF